MWDKHTFIPSKQAYVKGHRPKVKCILCSVLKGHRSVERLEVYRTEFTSVSVNLYPYTSGHLIIFPLRHITDIRFLEPSEVEDIHRVSCLTLNILQKSYETHSFNLGCNIGEYSSASISHLHFHAVPRFQRELGFFDILAGQKIMIEDPKVTLKKIKKAFLSFKKKK